MDRPQAAGGSCKLRAESVVTQAKLSGNRAVLALINS
jgi:hypothetical protein